MLLIGSQVGKNLIRKVLVQFERTEESISYDSDNTRTLKRHREEFGNEIVVFRVPLFVLRVTGSGRIPLPFSSRHPFV